MTPANDATSLPSPPDGTSVDHADTVCLTGIFATIFGGNGQIYSVTSDAGEWPDSGLTRR